MNIGLRGTTYRSPCASIPATDINGCSPGQEILLVGTWSTILNTSDPKKNTSGGGSRFIFTEGKVSICEALYPVTTKLRKLTAGWVTL